MHKHTGLSYLLRVFPAAVLAVSLLALSSCGKEAGAPETKAGSKEKESFIGRELHVMGTPASAEMKEMIRILKERLEYYTDDGKAYETSQDSLAIEIPQTPEAGRIFEGVTQRGELYFISQTDANGEENYSLDYDGGNYGYVLQKTIPELKESGSVILQGEDIASAKMMYQRDDNTGVSVPLIELTLTPKGTEAFAEATAKAFAQEETIGIYYDDSFISVPKVQAVISDGRALITGLSDPESAEAMTNALNTGALPFSLEEKSVFEK